MSLLRLFDREPTYIRRTRVYLQEARMAMLEHAIAAEHYQASADMYAERARRLEEEIAQWEAGRNGSAQPQVDGNAAADPVAPSYVSPGRYENNQSALTNAGPAAVGIARVL